MKVILKQDVKDLGKKGELVNVSDGYGKNYLIPRKLAVIADAAALNELKNREAAAAHRVQVERENAEATAALLKDKTVKISANAGANGKLFGSVTSKEIAAKIKEDFGVEIDRKKIVAEDIRSFGTFPFTIRVYSGIQISMYVVVGE